MRTQFQKNNRNNTLKNWTVRKRFSFNTFFVVLGCLLSTAPYHVFAQAEQDSTSRERTVEQQEERYNEYINTPYQTEISDEQLEIYNLDGTDDMYTFHKRLRYHSPEDFMFRENPAYDPYGIDWQMEINAQLLMVLETKFKDQNEFLGKLARIIPFLGLGFFEEYQVPIVPRMETGPPEKITPDN